MNSRRRVTGKLGEPEEAIEWLRNYKEEQKNQKGQ